MFAPPRAFFKTGFVHQAVGQRYLLNNQQYSNTLLLHHHLLLNDKINLILRQQITPAFEYCCPPGFVARSYNSDPTYTILNALFTNSTPTIIGTCLRLAKRPCSNAISFVAWRIIARRATKTDPRETLRPVGSNLWSYILWLLRLSF
jgi:hypothetical protein